MILALVVLVDPALRGSQWQVSRPVGVHESLRLEFGSHIGHALAWDEDVEVPWRSERDVPVQEIGQDPGP